MKNKTLPAIFARASLAVFSFLMLLSFFGCSTTRPVPEGYDAQLHPHRPEYIAVQAAAGPNWQVDEDGNTVFTAPANPQPAHPQPATDAADRSAVQVQVSDGGARVGIDLLGIRNYQAGEWARNSPALLKVVTYPLDYVGYMATNHPVQTLVAGLVAWELLDDGVSSLFSSSSSSSSNNAPQSSSDTRQAATVNITGDNNNVVISTSTGTTAEAPRPTTTTTNSR